MPRRLFASEYIFGLHEPGGEQLMLDAGRPGWVLFTEAVGRDPNNFSGKDFSPWSNRNLGVLCRINHGYHPDGTIPNSAFYDDFARRCANYVANSPGCKIWIIGNEMNFAIERPSLMIQALPPSSRANANPVLPAETKPASGTVLNSLVKNAFKAVMRSLSGGMGEAELFPDPAEPTSATNGEQENDLFLRSSPQRFSALNAQSSGSLGVRAAAAPAPAEVITPDLYVRCYRLCRDAIRRIPGHADDQVIVGAVAPWNDQTRYPGNPNGDWVQYLQDILRLLGRTGCDGIAVHTYTHGSDPNLIFDTATMNPPFQNRHYNFIAYRDFMAAIPSDMRQLPVYITETDQDVAWLDQNTGWVRNAYGEINWWNQQPGNQQIRSLILYRWPNIDKWVIETKPGVIADFRAALANDYRWREPAPPPSGFSAGQIVETTDVVNLRRSPGYANKPANDVQAQMPAGSRLTVLSGTPARADNLTWWNTQFSRQEQTALDGWTAQTSPAGVTLLRAVTPPPPPVGKFTIGDTVRTTTVVNLRRSPGYANKPANDVIVALPTTTPATVAGGPRNADSLTWWQLRGFANGAPFAGWAADTAPGGQELLVRVTAASSRAAEPTVAGSAAPQGQASAASVATTGALRVGDTVVTNTIVRLRRTPGISNKPANDVIADIAQNVRGTITGGPQAADSLTWWQVATTGSNGPVSGWMAEVAPGGAVLLRKVPVETMPPPGGFALGELVTTATTVRARRTPGISNKPADDTLGVFEPRTTLNILEGPRRVDNLDWWRVGGVLLPSGSVVAWVAEKDPTGATLVARPVKLPGTSIPDRGANRFLQGPYPGLFGISQLWGENPQIYSRIHYDGVPLKGHNGIDFLTPGGTNILATDDGVVAEAVPNDPSGFGHYVKLRHSWGESLYAHLESFNVQPGQSVRRGDLIARSDNTGFSNGPHLHFAIRVNGYNRQDGWGGFTDPLPYLQPQSFLLPSYVLAAGALSAAAAMPRSAERAHPLDDAPGYAPDQPGLQRP